MPLPKYADRYVGKPYRSGPQRDYEASGTVRATVPVPEATMAKARKLAAAEGVPVGRWLANLIEKERRNDANDLNSHHGYLRDRHEPARPGSVQHCQRGGEAQRGIPRRIADYHTKDENWFQSWLNHPDGWTRANAANGV